MGRRKKEPPAKPKAAAGSKRRTRPSDRAIRIGISGWTYAPWRGVFFPPGLAHGKELAFAASQVASIEINGTFYSLQRASSYAAWAERTPADFVFSVKAPRFITHIRRLKNCAVPLANFFASGVLRLGDKLGPILWQLPPNFHGDLSRVAEFLSLLPADTRAAATLAENHDDKVSDPWFGPVRRRPLRHALEVRHESFRSPDFIHLLRKHGVALVVADTAGKWPRFEDITADFMYVRLHGDAELYVSGYTSRALQGWARKIRAWHEGAAARGVKLTASPARKAPRGRDVFVYFDNDVKTHAPFDAMNLAYRLGLGPKSPRSRPPGEAGMIPRPSWPAYPRSRKK